jgi:hypothetical protein
MKRDLCLEEQVASSQVENEQLPNQVSFKLDTIQKLQKLVSSLERRKINLNSEVGALTNSDSKSAISGQCT